MKLIFYSVVQNLIIHMRIDFLIKFVGPFVGFYCHIMKL